MALGAAAMVVAASLPGGWDVYGAPNLDITVTPRGTAPLFPFITPSAPTGDGQPAQPLPLPTVNIGGPLVENPVAATPTPASGGVVGGVPERTPPAVNSPAAVNTPEVATTPAVQSTPGAAATPATNPTRVPSAVSTVGGGAPAPTPGFGIAPAPGAGAENTVGKVPERPTGSIEVRQQGESQLSFGDGMVTVMFPAGAVTGTTRASGAPTPLTQAQRAALDSSGVQATNVAVAVDTTPQVNLEAPARVSVQYTPEQVAGLDPGSLKVYRYDAGTNGWRPLEGCRSLASQFRVECTTATLGTLLLGGASPAGAAGGPQWPLWAGVGVLALGLAFLAGRNVRARS